MQELASWYRELAERAGNPAIWEGRLRMAGDLDAEADRIERPPRTRRSAYHSLTAVATARS
jgi:hypothetical protein